MLVKSQAVVFHQIHYNDSDSIVHLYSKDFGRMSYLAACRRKKPKLNPALLQPLSIIEYVAGHQGNRDLQRMREARSLYLFTDLAGNPVKNAISLFLSEILYRVLRESGSNPELFAFFVQSIKILDLCHEGTANFHIVFLIKLTRYLGFYPYIKDTHEKGFFDLEGGTLTAQQPAHNAWIGPKDAQILPKLLQMNFDNMQTYRFNHRERVEILKQLIRYYRVHLTDFPEIKSLGILQELFGEE